MNHYVMQQTAFATREEIRSSVLAPISDRRDLVVCPKPRRFVQFTDHTFRSPRRLFSHQSDVCDSKAGTDLLDIFLTKGGFNMEQSSCAQQVAASSPPFFCGSPPSRVANPVVQDARFGDEMFSPFSPAMPIPPRSDSSTSSPPRKVGFARSNFGGNPAVRVEGFDCLDRDSRNCSIPALA